MIAGARLAEHENPGEATVLILRGRVRLSSTGHD
jgi:quercetin dioxygenase-like cupin family protein